MENNDNNKYNHDNLTNHYNKILSDSNIYRLMSELKNNKEIYTRLFEDIDKLLIYQNRIIDELNKIVHKYEGQDAGLDTLEESLKEFNNQHSLAKSLQSSIFPSSLPDNSLIKISAKLNPMSETSGDFYDVAEIIPNKVYGAFVADIQGHGVSAALVTNLAKILFVTAVERYLSPKSVFEYINNEICDILHFHSFFTAFYIVVDFPNNQFLYSAGGHNYNLRYNAKTKTIERLETQDTIIGVINNNKFEEKVVNFNVGDRIIVYTDGIPEAKNQEGEFFTEKDYII